MNFLDGKRMRKDQPPQVCYHEGEPRTFRPGEFIPDYVIKKYRMCPSFFHPDTARNEGAFEFAAKHKGKFSVAIIRDMFGRGDVLMASVIAKALKYKYGDRVEVWYCVKPGYERLLEHNPWVDKIYTRRDQMLKDMPDINYNVNDLEFKSECRDWESEGRVTRNRTKIYLDNMGLEGLQNRTPTYVVTKEEREWAVEELAKRGYTKDKPVIGLQYFGSNPSRTYPHMDKAKKLLSKKYQTFVLDAQDGHIYRYDMAQIGALVEQMDVVVSPNSYFYHLAGALKKRGVAIFGSCDGVIWCEDYEKITPLQIDCPMGQMKCWWKLSCIPGGTLREKEVKQAPLCLSGVTPESVVRAVDAHFAVKKVLVVVLTYNLKYLTAQMVDSIRSVHNHDVLVIDNASDDGTAVWCKQRGIEVVSKKLPVAYAWNMGLKMGYVNGYDYVLLCNNDILLGSDYINVTVETAERRGAGAVTGQVINRADGTEFNFTELTREIEVPVITMAPGDYSALLISRSCIETIGGFMSFAPRYQADEDHLLRLRLSGINLIKTYQTTFFHKHGAVVHEVPEAASRKNIDWELGVRAFKAEWKIDPYNERIELNSMKNMQAKNPDWESKLYRPLKEKP